MNTKSRKFWKQMICTMVITCVLNSMIWIGFRGIPLMGLPQKGLFFDLQGRNIYGFK